MKIAVMSDLHLELDAEFAEEVAQHRGAQLDFYLRPPQPQADFLVLAGDIHRGATGIDWARHHFRIPVVLILGNHEAYGHELFRVIAVNRQRAAATKGRVVFLSRATWQWESPAGERLRLIGATLWTDFRLYGTPIESMAIAEQQLEDFRLIRVERGYKLRPLRPSDTARLHAATLTFLNEELGRPFDGVTAVVTHHAPTPRSIDPKFRNDPLNPAFASDLEKLIYTHQPTLWIHGHMHDSFDYRLGATRVVCNPRGYFPDHLNPAFDPSLVVEVESNTPNRRNG